MKKLLREKDKAFHASLQPFLAKHNFVSPDRLRYESEFNGAIGTLTFPTRIDAYGNYCVSCIVSVRIPTVMKAMSDICGQLPQPRAVAVCPLHMLANNKKYKEYVFDAEQDINIVDIEKDVIDYAIPYLKKHAGVKTVLQILISNDVHEWASIGVDVISRVIILSAIYCLGGQQQLALAVLDKVIQANENQRGAVNNILNTIRKGIQSYHAHDAVQL